MSVDNILSQVDTITDSDLELLVEMLVDIQRDRRKVHGRALMRTLEPGMKVRIRRDCNLRPKAILGEIVTVERMQKTRVAVRFERVVGRFNPAFPVSIPADCLELIRGEK